ncbi:MAG TPA: translation initiation factor [Polyangia bacterium]|nr:translation initiation factor [Polyangia bacterium]
MGQAIDELLQMVKESVLKHSDDQRHTGFDPTALLGHISSLFGQHQERQAQGDVRPASEDPYGDPADGRPVGRSVRPASQDPYGDPADQPVRRH